MLTVLWAIGITAEGMTGALAAGRERMDLFGVVMVALVTALGGGTIRDVLLGNYPLIWVREPEYLLLVIGAAILTISFAGIMKYFQPVFLLLDGLGLVVFSILGVKIAITLGHGIIIALTAAVVTGVAGGIMRDLLCDRIPLVFREELYASISVLVALMYMGMRWSGVGETVSVVVTILAGFILRALAIKFHIRLPVFDYQDSYVDNRKTLREVRSGLRNWRWRRPTRPAIDEDPVP